MYNFRIYNATNHDINFYFSPEYYAVNCRGQYFLTNPDAKPDMVLRQQRPLCAISSLTQIKDAGQINLIFPESLSVQVESLSNYTDFDCIIVSNIYAQLFLMSLNPNPDFADRLYTPVTLFSSDPQLNFGQAAKIGAVGLRKVTLPKLPSDYVQELRCGKLPSVSSMQVCLSIYKTYPYIDYNTEAWLKELESRMPSEKFMLRKDVQ